MSVNRSSITKTRAASVLVKCRRRCCICFFVNNIIDPQRGQIAHLNHDPKDNTYGNLVYLCLRHHDEYDSTTSQSKGFLESEVRQYQDQLFRSLKTTKVPVRIRAKIARTNKRHRAKKSTNQQHYLKFMNRPWRLTWLDEGRPELFAYKAMSTCDGICRIERSELHDGRVLFVCEDLDENPGQSTTNTIESIAFQLCKRFGVDPEKLVLLEHCPASEITKDEWLMVRFSERNLRTGFSDPTWHPMEEGDWRRLGYKPRKRPTRGMNRSSLLKPIGGSRFRNA